jgi:hypothetical protein
MGIWRVMSTVEVWEEEPESAHHVRKGLMGEETFELNLGKLWNFQANKETHCGQRHRAQIPGLFGDALATQE